MITAICCMLCLYSYGQTISYATNGPRSGDKYKMEVVPFFSDGERGTDALWDFSSLRGNGESIDIEYFYGKDFVLMSVDTKTIRKYDLTEDTLKLIGYENPLSHVDYTTPIALVSYPFNYGYSITNNYEGEGTYCKTLNIRNRGTYIVEADAEGVLVSHEGDTLKNILKIHMTRVSSLSMHAKTDTLFEDTARMKQEIEETCQWYARGYRYPLYETISTTYYDNMTQVSCIQNAYRYMTEEQSMMKDSVNEEILQRDSLAAIAEKDIIHYSVDMSGSNLTISYDLDEDASINAMVCSKMGVLYMRKSERQPAGTDYQLSFDCTGVRHDDYILYLNVNGKVYSEKFNVK